MTVLATADHGHEHFGPADAAALATRDGTRATWISLGVLALTAALQLACPRCSGSVALLADTIHNVTDALTAIPLLIAFRLGRRPPSRRYPYGYHRAEDVAGLVIVALDPRVGRPRGLRGDPPAAAAADGHRRRVGARRRASWASPGNEPWRRTGSASGAGSGRRRSSPTGCTRGPTALTSLASSSRRSATCSGSSGPTRVDRARDHGRDRRDALVQAARSVLHRALDGTDESTIALIETVAAPVGGVEHVTDARARWSGHRLLAELASTSTAALHRARRATRSPSGSARRCCTTSRASPRRRSTSTRTSTPRTAEPASTARPSMADVEPGPPCRRRRRSTTVATGTPTVETGVHCTRCGRPICPDCMHPGAGRPSVPRVRARGEAGVPTGRRERSPGRTGRGLTLTNDPAVAPRGGLRPWRSSPAAPAP